MKKVTVNASKTYDIVIEKGILARAGELCRAVVGACKVALISDSNVAPLYADKLEASLVESGFSVYRFVIRAGEESKCAENYLAALSFMAQNHITRSDCIIALGRQEKSRQYRLALGTFLARNSGRFAHS